MWWLFRSWGGCFPKQRPLSLSPLSLLHIIKNLMWHCMGRPMRQLTCSNVLALRRSWKIEQTSRHYPKKDSETDRRSCWRTLAPPPSRRHIKTDAEKAQQLNSQRKNGSVRSNLSRRSFLLSCRHDHSNFYRFYTEIRKGTNLWIVIYLPGAHGSHGSAWRQIRRN
jgi:hypothetical protein